MYFSPATDPNLFHCGCGCGKGSPDPGLIFLLEHMREQFGRPIIVTSGPRCEKHNCRVGGVPDSAHLTGKAADLACSNSRDRLKLVQAAMNVGAKRIGIAKTFIHVDVDLDQPEGMWPYST